MNKFKSLKVLSVLFLVFLLLMVGFDYLNANSRTVKMLKDIGSDIFQVMGKLIVENGLIVKTGNVGIGTTTPSAKLEVAGNFKANSIVTNKIPMFDCKIVEFECNGEPCPGRSGISQFSDAVNKCFEKTGTTDYYPTQFTCRWGWAGYGSVTGESIDSTMCGDGNGTDFAITCCKFGEPPAGLPKLVNNIHLEQDCTNAGGIIFIDISDNTKACKFTKSSCPQSWTQYKGWSETQTPTIKTNLYTSPGGWCWTRGQLDCSCQVGTHTWENMAAETCECNGTPCVEMGWNECGNYWCKRTINKYASSVTAVGCY